MSGEGMLHSAPIAAAMAAQSELRFRSQSTPRRGAFH